MQAANIVRWVDQDGVTHFGNRAPKNQVNVEEVFVQPTNQADVPTAELGGDIRQQFAANARNRSSEKRTNIVLEGPPERDIKPLTRPNSRRGQSYRVQLR